MRSWFIAVGAVGVFASLFGVTSGGCDGECEFSVVKQSDGCGAACASLVREDQPDVAICASDDCLEATHACEVGFSCMALGKPVCLPTCETDDDCEFGLSCVPEESALTGDAVKVCFYP
ncbi:MAG: hypothetical protein U0271_46690 [Polyangiaceae bacterium]